ncbi:MAG: SpoIIE family protein phosphatase [Leptospiraceae bacterium]|nr:SpoIIE family protein phosphatase [Leptospiraceae bacterium]MCP5497781.1 SpoIIE family protein phosphatase [Leptospiraceae bacterium]
MTKILIIDDDKDVRLSIEEILSDNGYETLMALDGTDGIQKVKEFKPDLIVCDIMMPGISGYEVLQEIQTIKELQTTPFIFLTGKSGENDIRYGMNLSVDDYLTKPFREKDLLESVQARLKRKILFDSSILEKVEEAKLELKEISVQKKFLASVLEISPEGVYIYDINLKKIIFYNSPFSQIMEIIFPGVPFDTVNHLDTLDRVLQLHAIVESKVDLYQNDIKVLLGDRPFWLSLKAKPFKTTEDGSILQYIGIVQDITEKKEKDLIIQKFYNTISKQLKIAKATQLFLVPEKFPDMKGFSFFHHYQAMDSIGGDFIDFKIVDTDIIDVILGDVSGHGISAAMVSTMANLIFKIADSSKLFLEKMFYHIHDSLKFLSETHYLTSVYIRLDTRLKVLYYSYAGHSPIILIRDKKVIVLQGRGHLLMLIPEPTFEQYFVELQKGDKLLVYSDGLYEIFNDKNDSAMLGLEGFLEWVSEYSQESAESLVKKLLERIENYTNNRINDDRTALCIEVN